MTSDDIIRMAQEAGLFHFHDSEGHCTGITDARLVTEEKDRWDDRLVEILAPFAALVAAAAHEECAKLCEIYETASVDKKSPAIAMIFKHCAAAIRARSKHDTN